MTTAAGEQEIRIALGETTLWGNLAVPAQASGIVLFAHGSGSSRLSPRNTFVARVLQQAGFATLLFDLLTEDEDRVYENRFDIEMLTRRLAATTEWAQREPATSALAVGYFGASTGAAAALKAAAMLGPATVRAVVSRGGRPDLAGADLRRVQAPTLLIVGGHDTIVIGLNREAFAQLPCTKSLEIVPGATHLFEEPGTLEKVARLAADWFRQHLGAGTRTGG